MPTVLLGAGVVKLDARRKQPLFRQIYDGIRTAILGGRLPRGTSLPSSRALAVQLNVSRMTVVNAYEQLFAEGYLTAEVGRGTFVSDDLPDDHQMARFQAGSQASKVDAADIELSQRGQRLLEQSQDLLTPFDELKPFMPGVPALDEFPVDVWNKLCRTRGRGLSPQELAYGPDDGYPPLRHAICDYVRTFRGVRCEPQQVMIVAGTQQALDVTTRLLIDPGDRVLFEDPGYPSARATIAANGAKIVPVPVDNDGARIDSLSASDRKAKLIYVTPSHQYPMGVTMSIERRMKLIEWADKQQAIIIEDDYDSEYRYAQHPIPSLQGLDPANRTVYVGSFSKVLFPSLGLGYVVVPLSLVDGFKTALGFVSRPPSRFIQTVVHDFIRLGHFERHLRRMRKVHQQRQVALVESVEKYLAGKLQIIGSDAGLHCASRILTRHKDTKLVQRILEMGILVRALSDYSMTKLADHNGLIFGFASGKPAEIKACIRRIATAF